MNETPSTEGFRFEIHKPAPDSRARRSTLTTPHGSLETPAFIFCATKGAIKGCGMEDLERAGAQIVLSNTYHLMLRPGGERVERLGHLHGFTGWRGPMLTDSGGFQVFSLGHGSVAEEIKGSGSAAARRKERTFLKITEEGALFRSYVDGSKQLLTPERSIQVQRQLGADLIVVLDECTPYHVDRTYTRRSLELTHRWADRCLVELSRLQRKEPEPRQALYGVVQGGVYPDLRRQGAEEIARRPFFGNAIGGSLGAEKNQMYDVVAHTQECLSPVSLERPVHLLGIGEVDDIWEGVERGIDTFDCVHPTRIARHGMALTREAGQKKRWRFNLRNARFAEDPRPIAEDCHCPACRRYSRAYLHYCEKAREMRGTQLLSLHNVHFMVNLMRTIRRALDEGRFAEVKREWLGG
jgi:queuine tRNA-ribosyltransferase